MKKAILALAALGSLSAVAQAQTSVTLYGIVDVGIVRESGTLGPSVTKLSSGIANGSRFGFKGVEDLGGGMTAFFDLQNGFQADTGALGQGGLLFGRQAFVGLGGSFGNIKLGRQYTPIDDLHGAVDPFINNYAGRLQNVFEQGYVSRVNNDIMTPRRTSMASMPTWPTVSVKSRVTHPPDAISAARSVIPPDRSSRALRSRPATTPPTTAPPRTLPWVENMISAWRNCMQRMQSARPRPPA